MIFAVIDTNVLVSSFISKNPQSATKKVVRMMLDGVITPLYDEDILAEYNDVLKRSKFHLMAYEVDAIVDFIRIFGINTLRTPFNELMPDESDRVFYEITLSIDDSFLVTGNLRHYPNTPQVVTPANFLNILGVE